MPSCRVSKRSGKSYSLQEPPRKAMQRARRRATTSRGRRAPRRCLGAARSGGVALLDHGAFSCLFSGQQRARAGGRSSYVSAGRPRASRGGGGGRVDDGGAPAAALLSAATCPRAVHVAAFSSTYSFLHALATSSPMSRRHERAARAPRAATCAARLLLWRARPNSVSQQRHGRA